MNLKPFLFLFLLACLIAPAAAAGGSGTAASPYIIETAAELQSMQNDLGAYYRLANDIDLSGVTWTPIGTSSAGFYGELDGNGKTIKNLDLSTTRTNTGFFGVVTSGATIKDITFQDCSATSTTSNCGVVIGTIQMSSSTHETTTLSNIDCVKCSVNLPNSNTAGCLVGLITTHSEVEITNCDISHSYAFCDGNAAACLVAYCSYSSTIEITGCNILDSYARINLGYGVSCLVGHCYSSSSVDIVSSTVQNSIAESINNNYAGIFIGACYGESTTNILSSKAINCLVVCKRGSGGILGLCNTNSIITTQTSEIIDCSIISTNGEGAGLIGLVLSSSGSVSNCAVTDCTVLGAYIAAGIANSPSISITGSTISNTNIYGSTVYDIGPSGSYDSTSTATGITHIQNRYLYASGLSYTTSGTTATLTLNDRQGAAVIETDTGAAAAMTWDYGDGTTADDTANTQTHTYANGIYSAGVVMSSYLATTEQAFYTTPINIGIPTYTANTVTTQDADIVIDAGQLYQAELQYVLPGTNTDLEFFADNLFIIASGNAVYTVDTATQEITPISTTTGNTADKIYLGENAAVITDINGNTAVYSYEENSFDYLASGNSQLIAATGQYAGVILNGKLSIYDLTEPRKIGDITATVTALAANDYAGTFAGYNDKTLSYWWIENGEIKSATQTLTHTITGIKQIPQTNNYILTTEANTVIVGITSTGGYSLVTTSDTELPLTHPQATTIGVVIGIHAPNEIYIVGADGSTAGTYQTGAALNDASITKATGLYAITGGNDQQAYILRKDQSSTWTLAQTIRANGALSHTQISTTGGYAAIVSGVNLYLLKITTATDTNYYLQGVVIGSTGDVYADKAITINGEKVMTDSSGRFTYPITPGTVYEIVADNTRVDYTATNAALQTLAIRLKPNPFAQSVSYDTKYNSTTGQFEMSYTDSRELTDTVTWVIRETGTQEIVSTQTTEAGQTAYWEVPFDKTFTSYQISMIADRQGTNVENVWILTPDGKNPIDIPGLDETGRNIIFGCVLMIFGGLFGVLHSTKGAILTVAVAGIMTYLGLLTIPWPIIMIAGTLAVLAALAKGSSGQ